MNVVVFDVGGTHVSAGLVRDGSMELQGRCTMPLDADASREKILGAFAELALAVLGKCHAGVSQLTGLSFAIPNPFDYEEGTSLMRHKYASLYGVNVRRELALRFDMEPRSVCFVNDACAFLIGEASKGAAVGAKRAVGITLGTGLGSAFMVNGRIVTEGEGVPNGGYIWNIPREASIVEDFISTRGIQRLYRERGGEDISVLEIATRSNAEPRAYEVMQQFGAVLGTVLSQVCAPFRPDVIVLGGAISRSAGLFFPAAIAQMSGMESQPKVSALFEDAALVGAAVSWYVSQRCPIAVS